MRKKNIPKNPQVIILKNISKNICQSALFNCKILFYHIYLFILFIQWFDVRKKGTNPQGLLIISFKICLLILAFMMEMFTLSPQYATFGTQRFSKNSPQGDVPCKLSLISGKQNTECIMSNISKFYNRISISLPFFSTIFYISNWLLILVLGLSIFYNFFHKEEENLDDFTECDDEEKHILSEDIY